MGNKAVSDSGPILHLYEIDLIKVLNIFNRVLIPEAVFEELKKYEVNERKIELTPLNSEMKDKTKVFSSQYELDIGEAEAIMLALNEKADYFLTDDLIARIVAAEHNLEVHGTIGIILRAFRDKIIKKEEAINKIIDLKAKSSLFITQDLVNLVINAVNNYKE